MKKLLILLLAATLLFTVAACSDDDEETTEEPVEEATEAPDETDDEEPDDEPDEENETSGEIITEFSVALASAPETIDPQLNSASDGGSYLAHLNQGLYRYKWDGSEGVELGHAESVDISDDGLTYTFTIRDDSVWSDGEPLTAYDFEYTFKRLVDPDTAAPYAEDMGKYIKNGSAISDGDMDLDELGVEAVDDKTFVVELEGPCFYIDEVLAFPAFMPVREDIIEEYGDRWTLSADTCIMAGPYVVDEFADDEYLRVVPNEQYYDVDLLVATEITFQFLANDQVNLTAFQAGEIVAAREYPQDEKENMEAQGYGITVPLLGTYYVSLNTEAEYLDDVNVRKALILAIDWDYICNTVMEGSVVAADGMVGYGFDDETGGEFRDQIEAYYDVNDYEGNLELAREALAEAGYPDGEGLPTFTYLTNDTTTHSLIAQALQYMWELIGVNVEISIQEWNTFLSDRRDGNYDIARNGWISDYNDPMSMLGLFYSTSGNNDGNYNNPEFDALIDLANSTDDQAERMEAMRQAEAILIGEDWAAAPIYYYTTKYLVDPALQDYAFISVGFEFFHFAYLEG